MIGLRYETTRAIDLARLAGEIQAALGLAAPPPLAGRDPIDGAPGVIEAPDDLDASTVATVIAQQPDADAVAETRRLNEEDIRSKSASALQANRDFLALASPTNAQTLAQVKALTRQSNGLIRLVLNRLDGTD